MRSSKLAILMLLPLVYCEEVGGPRRTLQAVQILYRHGEREPNESYKTSLGRLVEVGKMQMYELGKYLRERYRELLKEQLELTEVAFVSSEKDRNIQSSMLVAYGMYEDYSLAANWSGELQKVRYEPIPVRTVPETLDNLFQMTYPCPKNDYYFEKGLNSFFGPILANNRSMIDLYEMETKDYSFQDFSLPMATRFIKFNALYESIMYNLSNNLPIAPWTQELLKYEEFVSYRAAAETIARTSGEAKQLISGPFIQLLLETFKNPEGPKLVSYCSHDRQMYTLLVTLGIYDPLFPRLPPTGSSIMFELHVVDPKIGPFVEIWYRNDTKVAPLLLPIPLCGSPCYLTKFEEFTRDFIPVDYGAQCQLKEMEDQSRNSVALLVSGVIVLAVMIIFIGFFVTRKRRSYYKF